MNHLKTYNLSFLLVLLTVCLFLTAAFFLPNYFKGEEIQAQAGQNLTAGQTTANGSSETCQQYYDRRISEGWQVVEYDWPRAVLLSPDGNIRRELDLRNDVETLRPNATGTQTELSQQPTSGANWDKVDEEIADDGTTYVHSFPHEWKRDLYALPNHTGFGTINSVSVYARMRTLGGSGQYGKISIRTSGQTYDTSAYSLTENTWQTFSNTWTTNPSTAQAWTWDEIDSLEAGISLLGTGPFHSILEGQPVLMANGSQKNIENVQIGDEVISFNLDSRTIEKDKVIRIRQGSHDDYLVFNNILKTSLEHKIWASGEFKQAQDIQIGEFMLNSNGEEIKITSIEYIQEEVETYDLIIEKNHNFFAADYLVHNFIDAYCTQVYVEVDYTPPPPCNPPISGDYTVADNCHFDYTHSMVNGVEQGNLTINEGTTLTIHGGQAIVFNPGKRVSVNGRLAIAQGGRLSVGYVWLKDEDNNGYPATTTEASRTEPVGNGWKRRGEFKDPYGARSETWNLASDIKYDFNDAVYAVYPGTNCGEGYLCDVNTDAGTCGLKTASCLAVCQRCDGVSIDVEYASTAGHICYGSGQWKAVDTTDYCTLVNECDGACTSYTRYRGCAVGSTSCTSTNQVSSDPQYASTAGHVCYESGQWKAVDTTDYCTLVNECDGACTRASRYRGCTVGSTSCTATNQHTVNSYASTAGHVCSAGSWTATKTADLHCDKGIQCPGSTVCSATLYYRGCAIGGTSCVSDNWASYSTWNASADQAITQTGWVQNGTDCTQSSDQHCAACLRCDGGGGCSACLTHTNTGLFGCVPDDYCCHCECTPKHISCPF